MNISFQKLSGNRDRGVSFLWKLSIQTKTPRLVEEHFIPELFFDFFFIRVGRIRCIDEWLGTNTVLPQQMLKTIFARPLRFVFSTPLVLYGARLSLRFAESYWAEMEANRFFKQAWVGNETDDLDSFRSQVFAYLEHYQTKKAPYPMFASDLDESDWLVHFSTRHKRRLYASILGLTRKELQNIRNVHTFLDQTCDFASENPRILHHINPDVFYDQPHLNHTFKRMTGLSPVEYFEANSILQDQLMSASYNENSRS